MQITTITPRTPQELQKYYPDAEFLCNFFPTKLTQEEVRHIIESGHSTLTLVYVNHIIIGAFMYDYPGRRSVELHGVQRADIHQVIPEAKRVKQAIFKSILDDCFLVQNKDKVIIKAPYTNKGVRGFALMNGFKKLQYPDKGDTVWVLTREKYLNDRS